MVSDFLNSSRFLNAAAIHGKLTSNQVKPSAADRFFISYKDASETPSMESLFMLDCIL